MNRLKKHTWILWILLLVWQIILFRYLPNIKEFNEIYGSFFSFKQKIQNLIFGHFSFSIGDIIYAIIGIVLIYLLVRFIIEFRNLNNQKLRKKGYKFLITINILFFIYQVLWGLNYKRDLYSEYEIEELTDAELKQYANKYLAKSIELRKELPTNRALDLSLTESQIVENYQKDSLVTKSVKKSLYSELLNYIGILGYFNPITGEAQYNYKIPHTKIPYTIGHEMAHQNGVASESEANFESFLKGIKSENKEIQYSTNYKALRSLLYTIYISDSVFVNNTIKKYSKGMELDRQANIAYSEKYNYASQDAFSALNDAFLKANEQRGIEDYSNFVKYLVGYERKKK